MSIQEQVTREVVDLHQFFEHWLDGSIANDDTAFSRFSQALTSDFILVTPQGEELTGEVLIPDLRAMYAKRKGMKLWVEDVQVLTHLSPVVIARYREHQSDSGEATKRVSTAVFVEQTGTPNGVAWFRVHETWLDGGPPS